MKKFTLCALGITLVSFLMTEAFMIFGLSCFDDTDVFSMR